MTEDGEGVATGRRSIVGEGDFLLWLDQVAASRISPMLDFGAHRIESSDGGSLYLVSVPPGLRRPHSVASGETLRFPIRVGRHRRYLSEGEIADQYGRRFQGAVDRARSLDRLLDESREFLKRGEDRWVWLRLALVPDVLGSLSLSHRLIGDWQAWVLPRLTEFPCYNDRFGKYSTAVGFRSITIHDSLDSNPSLYRLGGELKLDGSGFLVFGYLGGIGDAGASEDVRCVYDELLVGDLINGLGILAEHARRSSSSGDVEVAAQLLCPEEPLSLNQFRSNMPGQLPGSRRLLGNVDPARRTFTMDGSADAGSERIANVRLLAGDLFSAFGIAEPSQINESNQLVQAGFQQAEIWPRAKAWADRHEVETA